MWIQEQFEAVITLDGIDCGGWNEEKYRKKKWTHTKNIEKLIYEYFWNGMHPVAPGHRRQEAQKKTISKIELNLRLIDLDSMASQQICHMHTLYLEPTMIHSIFVNRI